MNANQIYFIVTEQSAKNGFRSNPKYPDFKYIEDMTDIAYYSAKTILLRKELFESESDDRKKVILAHELGHHFEDALKVRHPAFSQVDSELIADWYVAAIGFKEELKMYRAWGDEFNEVIDLYQDIETYTNRIQIWHTQKNCGFFDSRK